MKLPHTFDTRDDTPSCHHAKTSKKKINIYFYSICCVGDPLLALDIVRLSVLYDARCSHFVLRRAKGPITELCIHFVIVECPSGSSAFPADT